MKLRKQTTAKAVVVAVTAVLMAGFFALVKAEPLVKASPAPTPAPAPVDYNSFFTPNQPSANPRPAPSVPAPVPHTRTRAS